jgi:hypothetical protein
MGLKQFLENNFLSKNEQDTVVPAPQATKASGQPTNVVFPQSEFPAPPPVNITAEVEQQYLDHFMGFLEKNNIPGQDYFEFANTLHKLYEKQPSLPEATLYDMAFTMFESQGVTSAILADTAKKYLELITAHKKEFDAYLSNEGSKVVQDKTAENAKLEKLNMDITNQIKALEQQIVTLKGSLSANTSAYESNKAIIQGENDKNIIKKQKFEAAFNVVIEKIKGDIQKIQSYLK